jgi:NAD-dependent deacetylase
MPDFWLCHSKPADFERQIRRPKGAVAMIDPPSCQAVEATFAEFCRGAGQLTVLTGAGISAESDIPTFRGPEGYWTVGSREYHPQEMATHAMFAHQPYEVWKWYLYRKGVCERAAPNKGHLALVGLEKLLRDRFNLITQNVDNLHLRAGQSPLHTFEIHGNIFFVRCAQECTDAVYPMPAGLKGKARQEEISDRERQLLACPRCGGLLRPHVLWFDETYNETHYRYHSVLSIALRTDLLLVVGTSGATNLPNQVAWLVLQNGGCIIDVNIEKNLFSDLARESSGGGFIQAPSSQQLPRLLRICQASLNDSSTPNE